MFLVGYRTFVAVVTVSLCFYRNDKCRGTAPSRAWLQDALSSWLPQGPLWHNAGVLAQGGDGETNIWDSAVEAGGVLHHGPQRLQRGIICSMRYFGFLHSILWAAQNDSNKTPPLTQGNLECTVLLSSRNFYLIIWTYCLECSGHNCLSNHLRTVIVCSATLPIMINVFAQFLYHILLLFF